MSDERSYRNSSLDAAAWLKRDIITGVLAPDEKLSMTRLRARYGLGVAPLREALSQLVGEQLVVAISQRGFRVAPMSLAEMHQLYDARAQLEATLLRLAIERGDEEWEATLVARAHTLSRVEASEAAGPLADADEPLAHWDARHQAFHDALVAGCQSPPLLQARATLHDRTERYRHLWLRETVASHTALERKRDEHAALVDVALARDSARAAMISDHLMTPVPIITEVLGRHFGIC